MIELASAAVLIWRLTVELRRGQAFPERLERRAARIAGALLFVLAGWIAIAAGWSLWTRHAQAFSLAGLLVASFAMPVMVLLARRKLVLAAELGSAALRADAVESITCGWLSAVVVVGFVADLVIAAWSVDAVASLGILWLVVREAREAWSGEACCKS